MSAQPTNIEILFEVSWEVCNKVGGIYTVLSTKAKTLRQLYGDKVIFIGPDVWTKDNPSPFFSEMSTPLDAWRSKAVFPDGVSVRTGRWDIPGQPLAILVKFEGMYAVKNQFYGEMWENFGVDSLHAYGDYDEACAFGHASGLVIESIVNYKNLENKPGTVIAHFDEWTDGMGLLFTRMRLPSVATVFTTHATSMGRSICSNGKPLYDYLPGYNGDQMAGELNMQSKQSLEKAAAHAADAFTTVSAITADECAQLLERRPVPVTPNGFEAGFVPARNIRSRRRAEARECLLNVAATLTGKDFSDDTFIIATGGRFEYRNKGLDMFLDSVKAVADSQPVRETLVYILVPAWSDGPRPELAQALRSGQPLQGNLERLSTHCLHNPNEDAVIFRMRHLGFDDCRNNNLTVIYVPCYLNGNDGIFNKTYYQLLIGMDATVFASYYEPWGYTPLESVAFGVPTVTTSLSGFGRWVLDNFGPDMNASGVKVVKRTDSNYDEATAEIARTILYLMNIPETVRKKLSAAAHKTAEAASWDNFIVHYLEAYENAIANACRRAGKKVATARTSKEKKQLKTT